MKLFLFNPENDIALASGLRHFTPPRQAAALHRAGAMLPFWLGTEEDFILVPPDLIDEAKARVDSWQCHGPEPISDVETLCLHQDYNPHLSPWGWSLNAIEQYRRMGVSPGLLGHYEQRIIGYRQLSHRQNQLLMLRALESNGVSVDYPMPIYATEVDAIKQYVSDYGEAMLKSPWSSSGRGVFPVTCTTLGASLQRIEGIIRNHGGIMAEPLLNKTLDFALLYNLTSERASFAGISIFGNSNATNYGGNRIASQSSLRSAITQHIPAPLFDHLIKATAYAVESVYGGKYEGPVGVDMMLYDDKGCHISPCIEVNLRYTMGFVALGLFEKFKNAGTLSISPSPQFQITFRPDAPEIGTTIISLQR